MTEKFQNKYRIPSHRKPGWRYSSNGMYFITLVTQHRICNLGEIVNENSPVMVLSDFGKIVDAEWNKSFEIRNELFLESYVIMPNHLHAIVVIDNENDAETVLNGAIDNAIDGTFDDAMDGTMDDAMVETHGRASLRPSPSPSRQSLSPSSSAMPQRLPKSISSFLAGFKSAVNSKIDDYIDANNLNIPKYNKNNHFFQPNYYDHIIRDDASFLRISDYIMNNPLKWTGDKLFNA